MYDLTRKPFPLTTVARRDKMTAFTVDSEGLKKMAKSVLDDDLAWEILSVVAEIPAGKVASYGQIAKLIGREKNARLVGRVLKNAEVYGDYPCHRVVNHTGRTAPGWNAQRLLLEDEGVRFLPNGCVDMKRFQWEI